MSFFSKLLDKIDFEIETKPDPVTSAEPRKLKEKVFSVAGASYYENNIKKLACRNDDWRKNAATLKSEDKLCRKIYRYNYINKPVKLIPEPTNKHDKNAVQVIIAGEVVGYVPVDIAIEVKDILKNHEIKYISSFISGGEYKVASVNDITKLDSLISIRVKIAYV